MNGLYLLFTLCVLGYSLYSGIVYAGRRHENKGALASLKRQTRSLRKLDPDERSALQPVLIDPLKPSKAVPLLHDNVLPLRGEFVRHGLSTGNGGQTLHNTLGGVDVVLPYDAADFLDVNNQAEVVLTDKFAIVVRLNNGFDLVGGRAREQLRQKKDRQWTEGRAGEVTEIEAAPALPDESGNPFAVQLLGQRDETPAEVAARRGPGAGVLASLCFLAGLAALTVGSTMEGGVEQTVWAGVASIALALGGWLAWKRPGAGVAKKVNRARGRLAAVSAQMADSVYVQPARLFLGDKFPLVLPQHWAKHAYVEADAEVELEMRVDDYSVVRYGSRLSLDEEVRRFPMVYWGRPLMLSITGALVIGLAALVHDEWRADAAQAVAVITRAPTKAPSSASQLAAEPPRTGDIVHVRAPVRCDFSAPTSTSLPPVDCRRVRWVTQPAAPLEALEIPPHVQAFYDGRFIDARSNPMLDTMMRLEMMRSMRDGDDPLASYYLASASLKVVADVGALVSAVQAVCATDTQTSGCQRLQDDIARDLKLDLGEAADTSWSALVARKEAGELKDDDNVGVTTASHVSSWQSQAHGIATGIVARLAAEKLAAYEKAQPRGVVIESPAPLLPQQGATDREEADPIELWNAYQQAVGSAGVQQLDASGMIMHAGLDAYGDFVLSIDRSRTLDNATAALMRLAVVLVGRSAVLRNPGAAGRRRGDRHPQGDRRDARPGDDLTRWR